MNNKYLLYGIGALVVIVLVIAAVMMKTSSNDANTGEMGQQSSLKDLIIRGGSQKCSFDHSIDGSRASGVVYIADGKMRGDFTAVSNGQTMTSHMIVQGDTSYVWTDATDQGFKMSFAGMMNPSTQQSQSVDINQKFDYDCDSWSSDTDTFNLPSTIKFQDMSAMMNAQGSAGADVKAMQCKACDQAPNAAAKAQCKAALGC